MGAALPLRQLRRGTLQRPGPGGEPRHGPGPAAQREPALPRGECGPRQDPPGPRDRCGGRRRGTDDDPEPALEALRRAAGFLRGKLGSTIKVRHVPELRFAHDDSAAESVRIGELIERAISTDEPR